jgi:two-component system, OmpR family, sensor histidine kinase VicK
VTSTLTSSPIDEDIKKGSLSDNATLGEQRIREIEKAIEPEFFEGITDHQKASQILVELAKSVKSEALILLPRDKSMVRLNRLGVIDYVIKTSQENAAEVKIICPLSQINSHIVKRISDCAPNIKILNGSNSPYGMFIVDSHKLFRAELREPNAEDLSESIGFTIFSTSKVSVNSFKSVFELLWSELILNEELKRADKMQKEFINIAAHELRTPAQSILGYAELAITDPELSKHDEQGFIGAIYRNAIRLHKLTKDILDVTKIESDTLYLNKELLNLNDVIANVILDIQRQTIATAKGKVSIIYNKDKRDVGDRNNDTIFVEADKERITQVIYNILNNAIKFSKAKLIEEPGGGAITITAEKGDDSQAIVNIVDTGTGIDSEITPRLFEKFVTKSLTGTGLGLYISKSIVEAHGGKIWAQNNPNDKGATFAFSLPLAKRSY